LSNVIAIAAGPAHALAIRSGPPTPLITLEPTDEYQLSGSNATFTARGAGLYGVTYQWRTNGVSMAGATDAELTVAINPATQSESYDVVVTDNGGMGSIVSTNVSLGFVTPPVINSLTPSTDPSVNYTSNVTLSVEASAPGQSSGFPLSYQWQFNGTDLAGHNASSYTFKATATAAGTYSVRVSNAAGSANAAWQLTVLYPNGLVIWQQPTNQYQLAGINVTFVCRAASSNAVTYQWQFDGTNIDGATDAVLTLSNAQAAQEGYYAAAVSDQVSNFTSSNAWFYLVTPPAITALTVPTNLPVMPQTSVNLGVTVSAPGQTNGFPLHYQWQSNGTNLAGATRSSYGFSAVNSGTWSVTVTNAAGATNVSWSVDVLAPGSVWAWGENNDGQCDCPAGLTNVVSVTAGFYHTVALKEDGTLAAWGDDDYHQTDLPPDLTNVTANVTAIACGYSHSLALRADGTVAAWGDDDYGATEVPEDLTNGVANAVAIAAGGSQSLALLKTGGVIAWGRGFGPAPADLTNATAIAAGFDFSLALRADGTVVAWGNNDIGQTNVPGDLTNVVAISAGAIHSLALKRDGTVVGWGDDTAGQIDVPAGLSNVMAVAGGMFFSVALRNDGTMVAWGNDGVGETDLPPLLNRVKSIAAGIGHGLAVLYSPLVQYPVDVTKDLLLIYNSTSTNSIFVKDYYLAHRPIVSDANKLPIACPTNEIVDSTTFSNQVLAAYTGWLGQNPTIRPQYVVLFLDLPSRVEDGAIAYASVQYQFSVATPIPSFVTSINMGGTNDCKAYVDKLTSMSTNSPLSSLLISASTGGYGNTNYYFDDTRYDHLSPSSDVGSNALSGVLSVNPTASITYSNAVDIGLTDHITTGSNVAGYLCWGFHSSLGPDYSTNRYVQWSGNSGWWIIDTIESFNGQRPAFGGNFIMWFSSGAFGGANYSNTPVGAVSTVDEPYTLGASNPQIYFGLWAAGKNFAHCAWNSRNVSGMQQPFQAVGDPFVAG
jgi:hypothetical protein